AAGTGTVLRALDEGEVLVRGDLVLVGEPLVERGLQAFRRQLIVTVVVLLKARLEGRRALARRAADLRPTVLAFPREFLPRRALARGQQRERRAGRQQSPVHLNLCRICTASPGLISTFCTWLGKVALRISIVCEPGDISSVRMGGLTPRLWPSTNT